MRDKGLERLLESPSGHQRAVRMHNYASDNVPTGGASALDPPPRLLLYQHHQHYRHAQIHATPSIRKPSGSDVDDSHADKPLNA